MRCRVADLSQIAEPIAWRRADGSLPEPAFSAEPQLRSSSGAEVAQLRTQLSDLERRRQMEVQSARQEGFAEGIRQTQEQAMAEMRAALDRVAATTAELANTKRKVRAEAELELVKLSVAIARRILHREIAVDGEALGGVVHSALQKLQAREVSRVRVFAAGAEMIRAALDRFGAPPGLEVYPDPALRPGDLIFETSLGQLDASVETQLQEIGRGLTDRLALPR